MSSPTVITANQLMRLIGLPERPLLIDVRIDEDFALDSRLIPGATRRSHLDVADWVRGVPTTRPVVVVCQRGLKLSQGVAAWLRHAGVAAESLDGGHEAWVAAGGPLFDPAKLAPTAKGYSLWVTRARPKIDRIACPWLIRRFIDAEAVFLYVAASEVMGVAERFGAAPYDIDGAFWSHRGESCSFDVMIEEFGLRVPALDRLALIVRGADTARLELAPQSAGLLAASLGLSRMYKDDLAMLDAGMALYDAFFRWCRDATEETHDWPTPGPAGRRAP